MQYSALSKSPESFRSRGLLYFELSSQWESIFLKYEVFVEQINLKCDGQEYLDIDHWRLKISAIFQKYFLTSTSQLP